MAQRTPSSATAQSVNHLAYTIILTTPASPTPHFLRAIQQSEVSPLFIGEKNVWFRRQAPSNWGWSHILIYPGPSAALSSSSIQIRQQWGFDIDSENAFVSDELYKQHDNEIYTSEGMKTAPTDLSQVLEYGGWGRGRKSAFWVLKFVRFGTGAEKGIRGSYEKHLREAEAAGGFGAKLHLQGKVTNMGRVERWQEPRNVEAEAFEHFVLMSFPSEMEYARFLMSDEHVKFTGKTEDEGKKKEEKEMGQEEDAKGKKEERQVSEGMVFTREVRLPPRSEEIDIYRGAWGNPYEPYGMDFFG